MKLSTLIRRNGKLAPYRPDLSGWSDDFRTYYSFMQPIIMDPFHPGILRASGGSGEDVVDDFLFGRDCGMSKVEWERFCSEVLLLEVGIPQTLDAVVGLVDGMLVTIVCSVVGCDEFSKASGARLMTLVMALSRFLLLCGGVGILPREYALARFGASRVFEACKKTVDVRIRQYSQKVVRRLTSLGRCVRGLVRVAWSHSVWNDPELILRLGLDGSKKQYLSDVWRAAVGTSCGLAVLMRGVVGASYEEAGEAVAVEWMPGMPGVRRVPVPIMHGFEDHEFDFTGWGRENPMSSDSLVGNGALALLVSASGRLAAYGGIDRQVKLFVHNFQMGFSHERHFLGLGGNSPLVVDLLGMMGIVFGVGLDGEGVPGQFRISGGRSWFVGGGDGQRLLGEEGEEVVASFLSALDGSRPVVVDAETAFKESVMASAREVVSNFARARGFDDEVMDMIAKVSFEDLMG